MTTNLPTTLLTRLITAFPCSESFAFPGFIIKWLIINSKMGKYFLRVGTRFSNLQIDISRRDEGDYDQNPSFFNTLGKPIFEPPSPEEIELLIIGMIEGKEDWRIPPEALREVVMAIPEMTSSFEFGETAFKVLIGKRKLTGAKYFDIEFQTPEKITCQWGTSAFQWTFGVVVTSTTLETSAVPHQFTLAEYLWLAVLLRRQASATV